MKIIHMSDLHLSSEGGLVWGVDTKRKFLTAISQIKKIQSIDAIALSGDISDDGSLDSYRFADRMLSELKIPTFCCPGNHDNVKALISSSRFICCPSVHSVLLRGWRLYFINSTATDADNPMKNRSRGVINVKSRENLNYELSMHSEPSVIILHHPPLEIGGWQDTKILEDRFSFREMLSQYENIKLVLSGHVHCFSIRKENGILYSTASSIGYAFDLEPPRYEIHHGHEGFSVISLEEDKINIENVLVETCE